MKIVVEDANVLLDLVNGGILSVWLGVGFTHVTTYLVWGEIKDTAQRDKVRAHVESGKILLYETLPEDWGEIVEMSTVEGISISDSSVWHLARKECAILLSGDGKLRKSAKQSGVEVRGVLWVLDELVHRTLISREEAIHALCTIRNEGAFLPSTECEARLNRWGGREDG